MPVDIPEATTVQELQQVNGWLEEYANLGLNDDEHEEMQAMIQKMDKWLMHVQMLDQTSTHKAKFAMELAASAAPVEGVLSVSTAHLVEATAKALSSDTLPLAYYALGMSGWMIHVSTENTWVEDNVPAELVLLMLHALECGCCWLLLDGDAPLLPDAPTFDW